VLRLFDFLTLIKIAIIINQILIRIVKQRQLEYTRAINETLGSQQRDCNCMSGLGLSKSYAKKPEHGRSVGIGEPE